MQHVEEILFDVEDSSLQIRLSGANDFSHVIISGWRRFDWLLDPGHHGQFRNEKDACTRLSDQERLVQALHLLAISLQYVLCMTLLHLSFASCLGVCHHSHKLRLRCLAKVNVFYSVQSWVVSSHHDFTLELSSNLVLQLNFTCERKVFFNILHKIISCLKSDD